MPTVNLINLETDSKMNMSQGSPTLGHLTVYRGSFTRIEHVSSNFSLIFVGIPMAWTLWMIRFHTLQASSNKRIVSSPDFTLQIQATSIKIVSIVSVIQQQQRFTTDCSFGANNVCWNEHQIDIISSIRSTYVWTFCSHLTLSNTWKRFYNIEHICQHLYRNGRFYLGKNFWDARNCCKKSTAGACVGLKHNQVSKLENNDFFFKLM